MSVTTFIHPVMTGHTCKPCGATSVRLGLRTDYSDYLRCDACGNWWQQPRLDLTPNASPLQRRPAGQP